jgi:hypothetical protein
LALVHRDAGSTFIRPSGEVAFDLEGRSEGGFSEGLAEVCNNGKCGFVDGTGKLTFSEGLAAVEREDLWGYVDKSGRLVMPFRFDHAFDFVDGLALVVLNGQWCYIDTAGRVVARNVWHRD